MPKIKPDSEPQAAKHAILNLVATCSFFFLGAIIFHHLNHEANWTFIDSMYFTIVTISTVGYGDLSPGAGQPVMQLLVTIYILIGIVWAFSLLSGTIAGLLTSFRHLVLSSLDVFDGTRVGLSGRQHGLSGKGVDVSGDGVEDFVLPPSALVFWMQQMIPAFFLWLLLQVCRTHTRPVSSTHGPHELQLPTQRANICM